jgi:aryl-alcohol dehydrogenase-like predicted oxidoreductase
MQYRFLGSTGLEASILGLGGNRIAESPDRAEVRATFDLALDRGINLIDVADCYGRGETERLVGCWTRQCRDKVILCTKVGYRPPPSVRFDRWVDPIRRLTPSNPGRGSVGGGARPAKNFAPKLVRTGIAGSLRRLGTDRIDIFYLHSPPPEVVADDTVFEVLEGERQAGRILHYGVSFTGTATTRDVLSCLRHRGVSVVQVRVNCLSTVDVERISAAAAPEKVAIIGREPFLKGRLLASDRARESLSQHTPAKTRLRAVVQRPGVDVVLVGTTQRPHLEENLAALDSPPLSDSEMAELWSEAKVL